MEVYIFLKKEIISIYENIYNQELICRNNLDNKFTSRLTIMITLITAYFIIFTTLFFAKNEELTYNTNMSFLCEILCIIIMILIILLCVSFYGCFYRRKKNYRVMPTVDIRMFHFYIHRNKLLGKQEEQDLYDYLNDSYQFCAYINAGINSKRERALIIFDNVTSICFILLIITYIIMKYSGYSINWIF